MRTAGCKASGGLQINGWIEQKQTNQKTALLLVNKRKLNIVLPLRNISL